jgi:uncharacterized protein (TIGR00255 family)
MIVSMTGFGRASKTIKKTLFSVEMRSVNSKFLEITSRMPIVFNDKENEVKELVGSSITRGKVNISVSVDKNLSGSHEMNLQVQPGIIKDYYKLLSDIKRVTKIKEDIKIDHILKFSEIFKVDENEELKKQWDDVKKVILAALKDLYSMKVREGKILEKDMIKRINLMSRKLDVIVKLSEKNLNSYKKKLKDKVQSLLIDQTVIEKNRLEYELVMLSDRLDVTEEVLRAKSHLEYFKKSTGDKELSGRRLNFLVQEINREINTIASKSNSSDISQYIVEMKEELEKIKEQLQNVE